MPRGKWDSDFYTAEVYPDAVVNGGYTCSYTRSINTPPSCPNPALYDLRKNGENMGGVMVCAHHKDEWLVYLNYEKGKVK